MTLLTKHRRANALIGIMLVGLVLCAPALATPSDFLARNEDICNSDRTMCIRGTLIYFPDSRVMQLSGRVTGTPGPGWVRILFQGNWRGNLASSVMEFPIRGAYSEIIDFRYIPDNPAVRYWRILDVRFEPDEGAAQAARDR
jgi:hypothetical protein